MTVSLISGRYGVITVSHYEPFNISIYIGLCMMFYTMAYKVIKSLSNLGAVLSAGVSQI